MTILPQFSTATPPVIEYRAFGVHARTEIETWRREYNEERPKKALGGLTPADYAKHLK